MATTLNTNSAPFNDSINKIVPIIMNICSILYNNSLLLQGMISNITELCHILNEIKLPLKSLYRFLIKNKFYDNEVYKLLQLIFNSLQLIHINIINKSLNSIHSSSILNKIYHESIQLYRQLEDDINSFILLLKRFGIYTPNNLVNQINSPWKYPKASTELPTQNLWPMLFLPNRNMCHHPRVDLCRKVSELIRPFSKPQHICVVGQNSSAGMGRTEMILECTYRAIENGVFGVVFWIYCRSEASLISSFRLLASRIQSNDPSFIQSVESNDFTQFLSRISKNDLIDLVIKWIERLELPYMIIFEDVVDISIIKPTMFPRCGQGTILLLTYSLFLTKVKNILKHRPKVIEFQPLTTQEGILMCEDGFDSIDSIPRSDMLDLISHYDLNPAYVASAITVINCMRNQSFLEIGPREYLNKLATASEFQAKGHGTILSTSSNLKHVLLSYQAFQMQLSVAKDLNYSSNATIDKILELLSCISPDGIDLRLLLDWIRPSMITPPPKNSSTLWRPTPIQLSASLSETQNPLDIVFRDDTEILLTVHSLLPRLVQSTGEYSYLWQINRTISDIEQFCQFLSKLWNKDIPIQSLNYDKPCKTSQVIADLNLCFQSLTSDLLWLQYIDHISCKRFLGIHIGDDCDLQVQDKLMFVISPLLATGILHIQHHLTSSAVVDSQSANTSQRSHSSSLLLGIHSSVQQAITHQLQITSKDESVSKDVIRFLYGYFLAPTEENWVDTPINKDTLLPHVISVVLKTTTDFTICLKLCIAAYEYSFERELFTTAYILSQRILDLLVTLHEENKFTLTKWKYRTAYSCYKSENYYEANKLYLETLDSYCTLSNNIMNDIMIAKLYLELSDINLYLNNYDNAAIHLISMSKIWFTLNLLENNNQNNKKYYNEIIQFYKKIINIKILSKNYQQAQEYCSQGIEFLTSNVGYQSKEVASLLLIHGDILMKLNKFHESKIILEDALKIYQNTSSTSSSDDSTSSSTLTILEIPSLLYSLSICCNRCEDLSQTKYYLNQTLDLITTLLLQYTSSGASAGTSTSTSNILQLYQLKIECLKELSIINSDEGISDDAISQVQEVYSLTKQLYGNTSHETAMALCLIGKIYKKFIKYLESEKIFYEVLKISEKCLTYDASIEALNNLADIYFSQSKYIETEQYLNKALTRLREIQHDNDNIEITQYINNLIAQQLCTLAELKKEINDYEKSRQYYEGALLILKTTYGTQHTSVAQVLEMLADLFIERGEERMGKRYRDEAMCIYRGLQNEGNSDTSTSMTMEMTSENIGTKNDTSVNDSTTTLGGLAALLSTEERYDDVIPLQEKV